MAKKKPAKSPTIAEINAIVGRNGSMNGDAVKKVPFEGSGATPVAGMINVPSAPFSKK